MTTAYERQVMAQVLQTYAQAQGLPVAWPNMTFTKPTPPEPWVRFTVLDVKAQQLEMGSTNNQHRVYGSLILQIFVPADSGDLVALQIGDAIGQLYRQKI